MRPTTSNTDSPGGDVRADHPGLEDEPRPAGTSPGGPPTGEGRDDVPPGWEENPSAWSQRLPIVVLAVIGVGVAGILAQYQQEMTDWVFEPFFGDGTRDIVRDSSFSQAFERFPIGDAALGAIGYLIDAVTGVIGGTKRWRTMPWIVLVFGFFVGPFGVISVMLIVFQPVLYGAFCTLCLASAAISLAMIGPAVDEILASLQYLRREHDAGRSWWKAFWGRPEEGAEGTVTAGVAA
ncbi:MAG: vitamin K epoxide reductase family protein [Actinomycetota bacterium]|nr:vitamin K epoxide reductase family protein [Actinomycetota bacterium]